MQVILEAKLYAIFSMMDLNYKNEEKKALQHKPLLRTILGAQIKASIDIMMD